MDKVITIHDYYDGIRAGVATFNGGYCIYESDFEDVSKGGGDVFYLTPISDDVFDKIIKDWERWIRWMEEHQSAEGWKEAREFELFEVAKQCAEYQKFIRYGTFHGGFKNFHSYPENLSVIWSDTNPRG